MKKIITFLLALSFFLLPPLSFAQTQGEYSRGRVERIIQEGEENIGGVKNPFQKLEILFTSGERKNQKIELIYGGQVRLTSSQKLNQGEQIILQCVEKPKAVCSVVERYRTPSLFFFFALFVGVVFLLVGRKGIGAILGMGVSLGVILLFIVPQILGGHDPLFISIVGSYAILLVSIFLAHGVSRQTTIALVSTCISLGLTALLAYISVRTFHMTGLGSEDAYTLSQGFGSLINFQGLLLGGIIIGTLGALDDVTTTQTATIFEFAKTDKTLSVTDLFQKGLLIGKSHIASLVNTLVLAYAGASITLFILLHIATNNNTQPLWVILNSEVFVEEIIRSLVGSLGIILAVPITTLLASFFSRHDISIK